jgi:hypothetical protein
MPPFHHVTALLVLCLMRGNFQQPARGVEAENWHAGKAPLVKELGRAVGRLFLAQGDVAQHLGITRFRDVGAVLAPMLMDDDGVHPGFAEQALMRRIEHTGARNLAFESSSIGLRTRG